MNKIPLLLLITLLSLGPVIAGKNIPYQLKIVDSGLQKTGDRLLVEFTIDYASLEVPSNDQLLIQPVIINKQDTLRLPFLLFPGKNRDKANHRKMRLYGQAENFTESYVTLYPESRQDLFTYRQEIPFAEWMYGGRLELMQDVYGCADCHKILTTLPLSYIANPPRVAFIVPVTNDQREDTLTLYFPWDQAVILSSFRNNAAALDKIDRSIQPSQTEVPSRMQHIALTGYASPEGSYPYNTLLSGRRVQAVNDYIRKKYPNSHISVVTNTVPEDWTGVRQWADSSDLKYRNEVIDIIDRTSDPDARDNRLRRLDNSATYHRLLREAYPPLRRVECKLNVRATPLTQQQIQQMYRSHPEQLSPAELYGLAHSYSEDTPEFSEIILTTVRLYPQDAAANNNAAALALQQNDMATARVYLLQAGNTGEAQNNQGVLLMLEGKIPEAIQYFKDACACGCREAILNLNNLERAQRIK